MSVLALLLPTSTVAQPACVSPDNGAGSTTLPALCDYITPSGFMMITDGLPPGTTIVCTPVLSGFSSRTSATGGSLGGDSLTTAATLHLDMLGTGTLAGWTRTVVIPVPASVSSPPLELHTSPPLPGAPVQELATDLHRLFGQLPSGDPDFDLLRVTAGTGFGLPSPGHTTLTRLPAGDWNVDSFFDITYRIDFVGAPGGTLAGRSGSTTATVRFVQGLGAGACVPSDNGGGTADLPSLCPFTSDGRTLRATDGLLPGDTLKAAYLYAVPAGYSRTPGGPLGGHVAQATSTLALDIAGTGTYAAYSRVLHLPVTVTQAAYAPPAPGSPVQAILCDLMGLQGQLTGDPDFDLLRITGGTMFGMPSPGHTTLTQVPGGWNVDSFFDITYRIDFVGAPGGAFAGRSGSTTATARIRQGLPSGPPPCPTISLSGLSNGIVAQPYSVALVATGGTPPYVFSPVGTLPAGLSLSSAGVLSGVPTLPGCYTFDVAAVDAAGCPAQRSYDVTVSLPSAGAVFAAPVFPPPGGRYQSPAGACDAQFAGGVHVRSLDLEGLTPSLPFPPVGGTVLYPATGTFHLELSTDGGVSFTPHSAPVSIQVRVDHVSGTGVTDVFDTEMLQLDLAGGSLPVGMRLRESPTLPSKGRTSGTTGALGARISSFFDIWTELSLDNGVTWSACRMPAPVVIPEAPLGIDPAVVNSGTVGEPFSVSFSGTGGLAPYQFAHGGGVLPPGLALSSSGVLDGVPGAPGCYEFDLVVTDATSLSGAAVWRVGVADPADPDPSFASNLLPPPREMIRREGTCDLEFDAVPIEIVGLSLAGLGPSLPPPVPGAPVTMNLTGTAHYQLSTDGGMTFTPVSVPATCAIHAAHAGSAGPVTTFDTEMLQLDILGGVLPGGTILQIRESPTRASLGRTSITDDGSARFAISSFFDIFTEISLDGGTNWRAARSAGALMLAPDPPDPQLFLTLPPETLIAKDVKGKFLKPVKRGKGYMPNWANLLYETVTQGGFQPGASESDSAGGLVLGLSHMQNVGGKWKVNKDSANVRGWVRLTKYNPSKGLGTSSNAIQKTLEDKTGVHGGPARGLDSTGNPGNLKRKPLVKQQTKLPPKKHSNRLFPELVALKVAIAASQLQKTPEGLGELIFDDNASVFDELSVLQLSALGDSMMTYWQMYPQVEFDSLYGILFRINRAFAGTLDSLSFEAGGKLRLRGVVDIATVPFLRLPSPFAPTILHPTTGLVDAWEDEVEFDVDEEFELEDGPAVARLYQNFPNPFNPATTIAFQLRSAATVSVTVFSVLGEEVVRLAVEEEFDDGAHTLRFDARDLASGVYFYRIRAVPVDAGAHPAVHTGKMVLMK